MKSEQLSVFLENRAGRLAEVTHTLAEAGVNIRALSLADTSDFGILRLIVCNHEKAQTVLKEKGFTLGRTHVVAVEVPDQPGGLDAILAEDACFSLRQLAVNGRDLMALGLRGREIGGALDYLLNEVVEGRLPNERGVLLTALQERYPGNGTNRG